MTGFQVPPLMRFPQEAVPVRPVTEINPSDPSFSTMTDDGCDGSAVPFDARAHTDGKPGNPSDPSQPVSGRDGGSAQPPVAADLTWLCGRCGEPVTHWDGYLYISLAQVKAVERATGRWEERHGSDSYDVADLRSLPPEAEWRVTHHQCRNDATPFESYCIDPGDIGTWSQLTRWTAHLMGKAWLPVTDWEELLLEVAGDQPSRRVRVAGRAA